jgi:hypothetical protein
LLLENWQFNKNTCQTISSIPRCPYGTPILQILVTLKATTSASGFSGLDHTASLSKMPIISVRGTACPAYCGEAI